MSIPYFLFTQGLAYNLFCHNLYIHIRALLLFSEGLHTFTFYVSFYRRNCVCTGMAKFSYLLPPLTYIVLI